MSALILQTPFYFLVHIVQWHGKSMLRRNATALDSLVPWDPEDIAGHDLLVAVNPYYNPPLPVSFVGMSRPNRCPKTPSSFYAPRIELRCFSVRKLMSIIRFTQLARHASSVPSSFPFLTAPGTHLFQQTCVSWWVSTTQSEVSNQL